jgi:hypothetical protein
MKAERGKWVCTKEMAAACGLSEYTVRKLARLGKIPARGGRKKGGAGMEWQFQPERVERVLAALFGNQALQEEVLQN